MAIIHIDETTVGLPNSGRLSGTNGDLVGIMDIAVPLNGWAIEYASGNARVYRPGAGNRFRLHMNDDSATSGDARLCVVRGCENASSATVLVDPFPTVALVSDTDSNWVKSSVASTTGRAFDIWVGETFVIYACNLTGTSNIWQLEFFGDFSPCLAGDSYNTVCTIRNTNASFGGSTWTSSWALTSNAGSDEFWICRSYDGTRKSVRAGVMSKMGSSNIGALVGINPAFGGPSTGIDLEKMVVYDSGSTSSSVSASLCIPTRGWLPNLLFPQHGGHGTTSTRDTLTNTPIMTLGKIVVGAAATGGGFAVVQESDDWTPPSG